jgi:predicted AAA+ superfamily ATPase
MKRKGKYLKRQIDSALLHWKKGAKHEPLLLRGARQVGKTSVVRHLGRKFEYYVEINFENSVEARQIFESGNLSPQGLCAQLAALFDVPIEAGRTLLFMDEIQCCPSAIASLCRFCDDFPELHVIATGALLEFVFEDVPSFDANRICSLYLYPLSFAEFLQANGDADLLRAIVKAAPDRPLDETLHFRALDRLKLFLLIGGMPETVAVFLAGHNLAQCQATIDGLITLLQNDFTKYRRRVPTSQISSAFDSVVRQMGSKFVYTDREQSYSAFQIKYAAELLMMEGLVVPVTHTLAEGLPLGDRINPRFRKLLLLDTGILQRSLGLNLSEVLLSDDFETVCADGVAEMFTGMELVKARSPFAPPQLFYWTQEEKNSRAEVDFVVSIGRRIVPLEVKSGKQGKMQNINLFMKEKQSEYGIRISLENFATYGKIKVYPLYAVFCI